MSNQINNISSTPRIPLKKSPTSRSVLAKLINAADQNSRILNQGFRYEETIKLFAAYIKMLGESLLYED